jgi:hypothetical protein
VTVTAGEGLSREVALKVLDAADSEDRDPYPEYARLRQESPVLWSRSRI